MELIFSSLQAHPYSIILLCVAIICITTRLVTSSRARTTLDGSAPRTIRTLPYSLPWLGHSFQFALGFQSFISKARDAAPSDCFALVLGGSKQNIITQPSLASNILALRTETSAKEFVFYTMEKFWNDGGSIRHMNQEALWGPVHKALYQLSREPFVSKAISINVKAIERKTLDLVSFNPSWVDQSIWERSSNISILEDGLDVAEVSLFPLIRDFVADIACRILMGNSFMENNPGFLADLFDLDDRFNLLMAGIPGWFPGMTKAANARERVINAVAEHHEAMFALFESRDPGSKWDDMSDVSNVIFDRCRAFYEAKTPRRAYACGDATIVWVMNVNANQVVFWMLWHVYSDPELLKAIRQEVSPFVKFTQSPSEMSIKPPPDLSLDLKGLMKECPLLNGAFLETMRVDTLSASIKKVVEDITMTESKEDAEMQGYSVPQTYKIPKGETVWLPHASHQTDPRYFPNPGKFEACRFWVVDERDPKKVAIDYGTMKVWGGGSTVWYVAPVRLAIIFFPRGISLTLRDAQSKGRKFAEMEVIAFAAAIFICWDIEPANANGIWEDPGKSVGGGTAKPKKDIRVRMRRRRAEAADI